MNKVQFIALSLLTGMTLAAETRTNAVPASADTEQPRTPTKSPLKPPVRPAHRKWLRPQASRLIGQRVWVVAVLTSLLFHLFVRAERTTPPPGKYYTSWLGNTYMDNNGKKNVTEELNDLAVSPNGRVFTAGYAETWGGGASYNTTNGGFRFRYDRFETGFGDPVSCVAASATYVYFGSGKGILRAGHNGSQGPYSTFSAARDVQGLFIRSGKLYVSDFAGGKIRVLNITNMVEERSWACPNPTRLTVDGSGNVWVVIYSPTSVQPPSGGPMWWGEKVRSFSPDGTPGPEITDFEKPLSVAINQRGQLLVGGLNDHSQLWVYDISGTPTKVGTFGAEKGIFGAKTEGAFTDLAKLHWIRSIAVDAEDSIYTGCCYGTFWGGCVEKWDPSGSLRWRVFAGTSLDSAGIDPENESEVYSKYHHYSLDYSKTTPGTEWSLKGFTVNRFKYPTDTRVDQNTDVGSRCLGAGAYRIGGKLFIARSNQEGYRWELYRQETSTEGEVLVPSVVMGAGTESRNKFYNPTTKTWYAKPKKSNLYNQYWCIAKNGDMLTIADNPDKIIHYKFGGLDTNSNPIWDSANATLTAAPELKNTRKFHYDSDEDVMYLTGDNPGEEWGTFLKIKRFNNWLGGNRVSSFTATVPYNDTQYTPDLNYGGGQAIAFSVAGDYMFVLYGYGHIRVLDKTDGHLVGTLVQSVANGWRGSAGQVDADYGMTATKLSNGEYILLFENAAWANIMIQRWCPSGDCPPVTPKLKMKADAAQVELNWPLLPSGFKAQQSVSLGPSAQWADLAELPAQSENEFSVQMNPPPADKFYRLSKP